MSLGKKMFHGFVWSSVERISVQALQFVLGIILARILTPKEYGIIGILMVFIAISNVFIDSGFTKALIQKQNRTNNDIATVFWFNILISLVCYVALWLLSPIIANFYELFEISNLLRVLAITLIVNALIAVPITIVTIELDFKTLTKINLAASLLSGLIAVFMAYSGYGVWALVAQILLKSILTCILIFIILRWWPMGVLSKSSLSELFSYGSKLLVSSLLNVIVNNFYALFIAKLISTKDLGYYTRGTQFSDVVFGILSSVLDSVLLPGLSTIQEQRLVLIEHTRSIIKATALFIVPIFIFLAAIAEPLIQVLLTDKWLSAVPIMQIFCIARLITIISGINVNLLYVIGRTDLALKQQYIKIIIRVLFFIFALKYGIIYIAIAELISTAIHFFINSYYPGKIMAYGGLSQLIDIKYIVISGLIMVLFVYCGMFFIESNLIKLCIAPLIAVPIYFIAIKLFQVKEFEKVISKGREFLNIRN